MNAHTERHHAAALSSPGASSAFPLAWGVVETLMNALKLFW